MYPLHATLSLLAIDNALISLRIETAARAGIKHNPAWAALVYEGRWPL